jgi:hypothetical protein
MIDDQLYSFVYKGLLTDQSLDGSGRKAKSHFGKEDSLRLERSLCFDFLENDRLATAKRMSYLYTAIHAFENMVRSLVTKAMTEAFPSDWWSKVPERIQKNSKSRMEEDAKFRWHGARGSEPINYCDFGDLSSIIVTNWTVFEEVVGNMEWAKGVLNTLEKSRNIIMHSGTLANEDIERIGMNIRDWIRQTG